MKIPVLGLLVKGLMGGLPLVKTVKSIRDRVKAGKVPQFKNGGLPLPALPQIIEPSLSELYISLIPQIAALLWGSIYVFHNFKSLTIDQLLKLADLF